jgi:hypothetical protein
MFDTLALDLEATLNNYKQRIQAAGVGLMAYTGAIGTRAPKFYHRYYGGPWSRGRAASAQAGRWALVDVDGACTEPTPSHGTVFKLPVNRLLAPHPLS